MKSLYVMNIPVRKQIAENALPKKKSIIRQFNAGKYVALDLSACDMGKNTVFGPGAVNTGESLIVSLVLPGAAKRIKAGSARNPTFRYFTSLRSISGGVEIIGKYAFRDRTALEMLNLPEVTFIGDYAFQNVGTADLTITLSRTAPRVLENSKGAGSYRSSYSYAKTVTIKRPSGGTGYGLFRL